MSARDLDYLTFRHVFPNDKPTARDLTVFTMTVGYIKRHSEPSGSYLQGYEDGHDGADETHVTRDTDLLNAQRLFNAKPMTDAEAQAVCPHHHATCDSCGSGLTGLPKTRIPATGDPQ